MSDPLVLSCVLLGLAASACAVAAVVLRDLLRAVAAFALCGACTAGIFFLLGAPFAGALELTVGAGLVSVLFLASVLLTDGEQGEGAS